MLSRDETWTLGLPLVNPRTSLVTNDQLHDLDLCGISMRERPELGGGALTLVRCDLSGADLRVLDLPGW